LATFAAAHVSAWHLPEQKGRWVTEKIYVPIDANESELLMVLHFNAAWQRGINTGGSSGIGLRW
jgi:hypothetical protein